MHMLAGTQRLMAQIQRLSQHDLSASAAIGLSLIHISRRSRMIARVFLDGRLSQISENADQSFCEPMALTLMYSTPSAIVLLETYTRLT